MIDQRLNDADGDSAQYDDGDLREEAMKNWTSGTETYDGMSTAQLLDLVTPAGITLDIRKLPYLNHFLNTDPDVNPHDNSEALKDKKTREPVCFTFVYSLSYLILTLNLSSRLTITN